MYNSRFFDEVKHVGAPSAYAKSRLVVQAFNDKDHGLLTDAPTVQRSSQCLLLRYFRRVPNGRCLCATFRRPTPSQNRESIVRFTSIPVDTKRAFKDIFTCWPPAVWNPLCRNALVCHISCTPLEVIVYERCHSWPVPSVHSKVHVEWSSVKLLTTWCYLLQTADTLNMAMERLWKKNKCNGGNSYARKQIR